MRVSTARRAMAAALALMAFVVVLAGRGEGRLGVDVSSAAAKGAPELRSSEAAVPVLLYHRLSVGRDGVDPSVFEAQMRLLREAGFEAITLDSFGRLVRGEPVVLPDRPFLITFDDGYVSSWKNADGVLARYGWTAAMYVATGFIGRPGRLTWEQLREMQQSRRWQIDEHAGDGHVYITADAAGTRLPFYAAARWVDGEQESFSAYKRRVRHDIERGAEELARHLPGWKSHGTFALPYGDFGQLGSNDPRIEPWLSRFLGARFAVTFARAREPVAQPGSGFVSRIAVPSTWEGRVLQTRIQQRLARP